MLFTGIHKLWNGKIFISNNSRDIYCYTNIIFYDMNSWSDKKTIRIIITVFSLGHLEIEKSPGARQGGHSVTWFLDKYELLNQQLIEMNVFNHKLINMCQSVIDEWSTVSHSAVLESHISRLMQLFNPNLSLYNASVSSNCVQIFVMQWFVTMLYSWQQ